MGKNIIEIIDEEIIKAYKISQISKMIDPTILMNNVDFDELKKEVEQKTNIKVGHIATYKGINIIARDFIAHGKIVICDNACNIFNKH